MNKITFVILTLVVTFLTGFLGLIPMLIIGFNMFGSEGKTKEKKEKKPKITKEWHVFALTAITIPGFISSFAEGDIMSGIIGIVITIAVFYFTSKRLQENRIKYNI